MTNQTSRSLFASANFVDASKSRYKYRLQGIDQDWIVTAENRVNYTIQRPGEYVFEVYAANSDGIWNAT